MISLTITDSSTARVLVADSDDPDTIYDAVNEFLYPNPCSSPEVMATPGSRTDTRSLDPLILLAAADL